MSPVKIGKIVPTSPASISWAPVAPETHELNKCLLLYTHGIFGVGCYTALANWNKNCVQFWESYLMRDFDKLEWIYKEAAGTMKGHKDMGYKEQLMTLVSFMLKIRSCVENVKIATKHVINCHMKQGVDLLFITLGILRPAERNQRDKSLHQNCLGLDSFQKSWVTLC